MRIFSIRIICVCIYKFITNVADVFYDKSSLSLSFSSYLISIIVYMEIFIIFFCVEYS